MDDTAEGLLETARVVRRRLQAELIAAEASANRDDRGVIVRDEAKDIALLQAKVEYLNSIVARHEQEVDEATGWPLPDRRPQTALISYFA